MEWINVKKRLPYCNKKWGDSKHLLLYNEENYSWAVGWYNNITKQFTISHYIAPSTKIDVTHWMPLPKPPEEKNKHPLI